MHRLSRTLGRRLPCYTLFPQPRSTLALVTCSAKTSMSTTPILVFCKSEVARSQIQQALSQEDDPSTSYHFSDVGIPTDTSLSFNGDLYLSHLTSRSFGHVLMATPEISSTQEFIRANSRWRDGLVLVADRQTSGKGRGGNQWTSPEGCLMFTAARLLQVQSPSQAPFINYLLCLAVLQGIVDAVDTVAKGLALDIHIKWPNDIYSGGLKIGGALIHTTWQRDRFNVIAGVGLNAFNRQPTVCVDDILQGALAAAGRQAEYQPVGREVLLARIITRLEENYDVFEQQGFAPLQEQYLRSWLHSGQCLMFEDSSAAGEGTRTRLTIQGLSPSGFLLAHDDKGMPFELTPDGNSLDMMQGLIKRKLYA